MAPVRARIAVSALFALDGAVLGGWMAHLPDVQTALRLDKGQLGATLLATSVGALVAMPLTGTLVARFGSRRVSLVAAVFVLTIVPTLLRAPSQGALALTLVLLGATNGTLDVAMNAHAMAVQARYDRPIVSATHAWFAIGGFLGGAGTSLANRLGATPWFHLMGASCLLLASLAGLAGSLLPAEADRGGEGARFVIPHGRLLALGLLTLLAFFTEGALWDWSAVYFRDFLRTSRDVAALGFAVGSGAMALGRFFGDAFVANLGSGRALQISGLLAGGGLLVATALPTPAGAFLGFGLAGLGLANAVPVLFTAAAEYPGVSPGAGLSAVTTLGYAAFLGGPPLVGGLAQVTSMRASLGLVGLLALVVGVYGPRAVNRPTA